MVKTTKGVGLIPSRGAKIQHATWYDQKLKEKKMKVTKGLPLDFSPYLTPLKIRRDWQYSPASQWAVLNEMKD